MATKPEQPPPGDDLGAFKAMLRARLHWRDALAAEVARMDADLAADARTFRTLNGDLVVPTLDQLRRMLAEPGKDSP